MIAPRIYDLHLNVPPNIMYIDVYSTIYYEKVLSKKDKLDFDYSNNLAKHNFPDNAMWFSSDASQNTYSQ